MTSPNNFSEEKLREQYKKHWFSRHPNSKVMDDSMAIQVFIALDKEADYWLKVLADYKAHLRERADKMKLLEVAVNPETLYAKQLHNIGIEKVKSIIK